MSGRKLKNGGELAFVLGTVLLGAGTAVMAEAGFGLSVTVSPAYVLSYAVGVISPGAMCYICQGGLVLAVIILRRRLRPAYLFTFLSAVLFGLTVDFFSDVVLSALDAGSMGMRIGLFIAGQLINSLSIAFLLNSYLPPQAPELFVRELAELSGRDMYKLKYAYDLCSFVLSVGLSLLFFRSVRGVGIGTVISALVNGPLIAFFGKLLCRVMDFRPAIPWLERVLGTAEDSGKT